jgi:hypothetical protein
MDEQKIEMFLDSGAFTAYAKGEEIKVEDYIEFIKKHERNLAVYANLDVIGDAEGTWHNQEAMEEAGLSPIPVYHLGDEIKYLRRCLEYDYFCLGGMAAQNKLGANRQDFLDRCWNIICDTPDRKPINKVHGFGMTSLKLMLRYPWYSVDSTTWVTLARTGKVLIPRYSHGRYIYDENAYMIEVSSRSPRRKIRQRHIDSYPKEKQRRILEYIESKGYVLGKSEFKYVDMPYELADNEKFVWRKASEEGQQCVEVIEEEGIANNYKQRDELNLIYFLDLEERMPDWPWPFHLETELSGFDELEVD